MTHSQMHAGMAIGATVLVGAFIAFLPPVPPASAQSHAQRICREEGVKPTTETYEYCLSQTTRALEWGEPVLARGFARVAVEARDACSRKPTASKPASTRRRRRAACWSLSTRK